MAAVMTTPRIDIEPAVTRTVRRVAPRSVARRGHRPSAATYWRRRAVAVAVGLVALVMAGKAGAALGGSPLAVPERRPAVSQPVVQPGDSLWSIAARLEPDRDLRPVVDELTAARGRAARARRGHHPAGVTAPPARNGYVPWSSALPVLPDARRQGRRFAPVRRRRRDPAAA